MLTVILFLLVHFGYFQTVPSIRPGYEYNDTFARNEVYPLIIAALPDAPEPCLRDTLPAVRVQAKVLVNCSNSATIPASCYSYVAVNTQKKMIVIVTRGTKEDSQMDLEQKAMTMPKTPFYNVGTVQSYFYFAFEQLWKGGINGNLTRLKQRYPDYDLLVTGHSLGGSLSSLIASRVIYEKIYPASRVKFITFGQPRTGDSNYANWINNNFLYFYRVVMRNDPASRMPPVSEGYLHHHWEIWYNNDMSPGSSYTISGVDKGLTSTMNDDFHDHLFYFGKDLGEWINLYCKF